MLNYLQLSYELEQKLKDVPSKMSDPTLKQDGDLQVDDAWQIIHGVDNTFVRKIPNYKTISF